MAIIPKNIKIPSHWLIDTRVTTYWPHKEGIWVDKETEPALRFVAVYLNLMEIPDAKSQLTQCNDQFVNGYASELLSLLNPVIARVRAGKASSTPHVSEAENEKIVSIYRQWVDTWALGSNKMLEWVSSSQISQILLNMLPFRRRDLRRLESKLRAIGNQFCIPWVWETLLSGHYRRLEQTQRELARRTVQSQGFYHLRERTLLIHARYFIIVRILAIKQNVLLDELAKNCSRGDFNLTTNDLTDRILRPFDDVFAYERKPGRPTSVANASYVDVKMR